MENKKEAQERQAAEEIRTLYHQSPLVLFSNVLVSAIAAWAFWGRPQGAAAIGAWLGYQVGLNILRATLVAWFKRGGGPRRARAWARAYAVGALLSGLGWGMLAMLVFDPADARSLLFACVFIAGMVAGSMATLPWHFPTYVCFVAAALIPVTLRCLAQEDRLLFSVGLAGLSYLGFNLLLARRVRAQMVLAVRLAHENLDLVGSLRREKARAEEASRAKSRFLAAASHDLRQPVNVLALFSESLGRSTGREQRRLASRIQAAARVLSGMLHSLLDLSVLDSGSLQPRPAAMALGPLLNQLREEMQAPARRQGLSLRVPSSRSWVLSDPEMLGRVLRNLLANAIRHGKAGRVWVECAEKKGSVMVSICDQGAGIPRALRRRVFEEFVQLDNPERDLARGLGLGLSIVKSLCAALGHPLKLRSVPELKRGTRFSVTLPRVAPPRHRARDAAAGATADLKGKRILVVDDNLPTLQATGALLRAWGLRVTGAASPEAALRHLRGGLVPDAVLCDFRLQKGVRGVELLKKPAFARIPRALITGDTHAAALKELKASGFPVLFKPLSPGRLRALLSHLLLKA